MPLVKLKINGKEVEAEQGKPLLQELLDRGQFVPHYCYHPGLSVSGNCRMCLVKVNTSRKPETSCTMRIAPNLEVETDPPEIVKARKDILEFLLINHPLDCPVCDQAGECLLQDFSYTYGPDRSRFVEAKVTKSAKPFGPLVHYWGNRCIVCTRCVRFCDEVAGTGELGVVNRGDHSEIDVFPGLPLENPLSGNVVDICPVGALLNRDFLYQARVWFMKTTDSICAGCGRGCNVHIDALHDAVKRLRPRTNRAVNDWWMCDAGRLTYKTLAAPTRLREHRVRGTDGQPPNFPQAVEAARNGIAAAVSRHGAAGVAAVASGFSTNEELFLFRKLMTAHGVSVAACLTRREGSDQRFRGGFAIEAEKAPNRRGAELLLGPEVVADGAARLAEAIRAGTVRALIVLHGDPRAGAPEALAPHLDRISLPLLIDVQDGPLARRAEVVLAGAGWAEKDGTMVNSAGRVQRLRKAVEPPGSARADLDLLQELLVLAGERANVLSSDGVFRELADASPAFRGLTVRSIGAMGAPVADGASKGEVRG